MGWLNVWLIGVAVFLVLISWPWVFSDRYLDTNIKYMWLGWGLTTLWPVFVGLFIAWWLLCVFPELLEKVWEQTRWHKLRKVKDGVKRASLVGKSPTPYPR